MKPEARDERGVSDQSMVLIGVLIHTHRTTSLEATARRGGEESEESIPAMTAVWRGRR
jgi:hypothetical protein